MVPCSRSLPTTYIPLLECLAVDNPDYTFLLTMVNQYVPLQMEMEIVGCISCEIMESIMVGWGSPLICGDLWDLAENLEENGRDIFLLH